MARTPKLTKQEVKDVEQARELGKLAFESGINSAPHSDEKVIELAFGYRDGYTKAHVRIAIFKAWANGWHTANLSGM